ncbi:hypothetical protein [Ignatzschineria cameli]|uniref:hypothetical protein n=1 Tax=Ignatzschineria cameli TaxID=2182793 RepID=UPI00105781DD|nr:hypothetical protein [Ignatzschineria cameli]
MEIIKLTEAERCRISLLRSSKNHALAVGDPLSSAMAAENNDDSSALKAPTGGHAVVKRMK